MVAINKLAYAAIKNSMKFFDIIQYPCMTNKAHLLNNNLSQVVIFVSIDANKNEIKKAVEAIFGIEVDKVNTVIVKGKRKRSGAKNYYNEKDRKKAIVIFKDKNLANKMRETVSSGEESVVSYVLENKEQ